MNPDTPWIVSFIQQAFSQYPNQAEDDGSHLSFGNNGNFYIATVQEWGVGPSGHGAVLKDSEHQIDAVLSRGTQSFYDPASNSYQKGPSDVRNHLIKLLDFKLVFTYKETVPHVHLIVNEFSIDFENGKSKNVVPKKKLIRNQAVRSLMESMHQQIPGSPKTARPGKSRDHTVRNTPTQTPTKSNALGGFGSQGFSSQTPSNQNAFGQLPQAPAVRSHNTNELLQHLGPTSPGTLNQNTSFSLQQLQTLFAGNDSREELLKVLSSAGGTGQVAPKPTSNTGDRSTLSSVARPPINSRSRDSKSDDEGSINSQGKTSPAQTKPVRHEVPSSTKKRPRETSDVISQTAFHESRSIGLEADMSPHKRQRTGATADPLEKSVEVEMTQAESSPPKAQSPVTMVTTPHKVVAARTNPWKGMRRISNRDVVIPKDQQNLLDPVCWIPSRPNEPAPQGHVPPPLLEAWNSAIQRRHRRAEQSRAVSVRSVSPSQESDHESIASSSSKSIPWSVSPDRSPPSHVRGLPPSSPVLRPTSIRSSTRKASDVDVTFTDSNGLAVASQSELSYNEIPRNVSSPGRRSEEMRKAKEAEEKNLQRLREEEREKQAIEHARLQRLEEEQKAKEAEEKWLQRLREEETKKQAIERARLRRLEEEEKAKEAEEKRLQLEEKRAKEAAEKKLQRLEEEKKARQAREERVRLELVTLGPPPDKKRKNNFESHGSQTTTSHKSPKILSSPQAGSLNRTPRRRSPSHGGEMNPPQLSQTNGTPAPNQEKGRRSSTPPINPVILVENDSDDESVMDTSVPFALGEPIPDPTQSSLVEEELTSSGPSLPGVSNECIQVAVTPMVDSIRSHRDRIDKSPIHFERSDPDQGSSQGHKSSSQSRVLNTYPFNNSHEEIQSSSNPDESSQDRPIQVEAPLTQPQASSMASQSQSHTQDLLNQSQPDILLDSSGPTQRHQDFPLAATQRSPLQVALTSPRHSNQLPSNNLEETRASASEKRLSNDLATSPEVALTQSAEGARNEQSPSSSRGCQSMEQVQDTEAPVDPTANTQSAQLLARRQGFISSAGSKIQAPDVYRQFCSYYSSYFGDFDHFTLLCRKLHAFRQQGKLPRSFLWDDFIIMHLQSYPRYLDEHISQDSNSLSYEDYFLATFSSPFYKKRSLTAQGIEAVASQPIVEATRSSPFPVPSPLPRSPINVSFTASLVDKFTDFHTQSFNATQDDLPPVNPEGLEAPTSSPEPIKLEGGESSLFDFMNTEISRPVPRREKRNPREVISHAAPEPTTQSSPRPFIPEDTDIEMIEIPETDPEDNDHDEQEEQDDDTLHETASVELGDESFISSTRPHSREEEMPVESAVESAAITAPVPAPEEQEQESEDENENWFLSLRHLRPKRGVWSDGPTEFKRWAEGDQNMKIERDRRDGAKIELDEYGVIRRPVFR
ncbi:hypothetical protein N7488_000477 [Penicillium malachiteum]|nr:hypothetical protein N7488_000477 [Penicillium malachiteum]